LASVSKELAILAKNLLLFIGKDKNTEALLKNMDLSLDGVSDDTRESVSRAAGVLRDEKLGAEERIDKGEEVLKKLNRDERVPLKIRELVIATTLERLAKARKSLRGSEVSIVAGIMKFQPTLELLILDDSKTLKMLRKLGIRKVSLAIREAAVKAKKVLEDKSLDERERATRAADILAETLQPAYFGGRNSPPISNELKTVLWEIAHALSQQGSKK